MNEKINNIVENAIEELGYDDTFLVELNATHDKIEVFLDSDHSVTFEMCRKISRKMEAILDESNLVSEKYRLDVSSAGVGRPLKYKRQYIKNIGRHIEISKNDGDKIKGLIVEANEEHVTVEYTKTEKQGKKKKKVKETVSIIYDDIDVAKIKIIF